MTNCGSSLDFILQSGGSWKNFKQESGILERSPFLMQWDDLELVIVKAGG